MSHRPEDGLAAHEYVVNSNIDRRESLNRPHKIGLRTKAQRTKLEHNEGAIGWNGIQYEKAAQTDSLHHPRT